MFIPTHTLFLLTRTLFRTEPLENIICLVISINTIVQLYSVDEVRSELDTPDYDEYGAPMNETNAVRTQHHEILWYEIKLDTLILDFLEQEGRVH